MSLTEMLVSLLVLSIFATSAFSFFSASRNLAVKMEGEIFEADSLRVAVDTIARDLSAAGCGIPLEGDLFTPLILGDPPDGKDWSESFTVYSNTAGKEAVLAEPARAGTRTVRVVRTNLAKGDRMLLRSSADWEVARVAAVSRSGSESLIDLRDSLSHAYGSASGVETIQYSYDRRRRVLYRSENGGTRQPLLERCSDFKLRLFEGLDHGQLFGRVMTEGLLVSDASVELAAGGRTVSRAFPLWLGLLDTKFVSRPFDESRTDVEIGT